MSATSEDLIQRRLEEERARLARELGIEEVEREPHARPVEHGPTPLCSTAGSPGSTRS
jgi:hypothetical protein